MAATTARATQSLSNARHREISTTGADQSVQVEFGAIAALPLMLQPFTAVVEAAHVQPPAEFHASPKVSMPIEQNGNTRERRQVRRYYAVGADLRRSNFG